jgi:hypothetical protein
MRSSGLVMRTASSIEVTPTAVNCAVITGWRHEAGTNEVAARL